MKRDINRGARTDAKWCVKGKRGGVDHIPPSIKTTIFPKKKRGIKKEGNVYRSRMPLSYKKPNRNYLSPSILEIYIAY